jgi:hypothetical protein
MSEAEPDIEDVDALLNEALRADVLALRHVNAQLLATTEPDVLNGHVRSQQRITRSLRTTITTKARLARERAEDARRTAEAQPRRDGPAAASLEHPDQRELEEAALARVRLEYDPAETEEIDAELGLYAEAVLDEEGADALSPEARIEAVMARVRADFGARNPPPAPPEPQPEQGDLPPWERRPPGAIPRGGGGSGW